MRFVPFFDAEEGEGLAGEGEEEEGEVDAGCALISRMRATTLSQSGFLRVAIYYMTLLIHALSHVK